MAGQARTGSFGSPQNPGARLPQLMVTICSAAIAFTGAWLWWFGEETTQRRGSITGFADPFTVQLWIRRIHWISAFILVALIVSMMVSAATKAQNWRLIFLVLFLVFTAFGLWAGYDADWEAARLWSSTVGSRFRAGLPIGDGPALPSGLRSARVHLSIVPAALLAVAVASFIQHHRRRR